MPKRLRIQIFPDGRINATTDGFKGKECLDCIQLLEAILEAQTVHSEFTSEYHETELKDETLEEIDQQSLE